MPNPPKLWAIHAGATGDAATLFLEHNVVALGWKDMPPLDSLSATREAFRAKLAEIYPDKKPQALNLNTGQLFRFFHEMKIGDLVAYPNKRDRRIYIGRIEGNYSYNRALEPAYPHHRSVKWLKSPLRTAFSQGALYEINSSMSFFLIKNYPQEYHALLQQDNPVSSEEGFDPTIAVVSQNIEEVTADFILKRLAQELKGHPFAGFVAHLLNIMGYHCRVSPPGPDGGVDIIAHKDELGFEPPIIKVQVKSTETSSIGQPEVSALLGTLANGEFALFVTLGTFTIPARNFAKGKSHLRLIDGTDLIELIIRHYESFDPSYKGVIPLKRIYVPQTIEEFEAQATS